MIYLDYQAATPLAPEARAAMLAWLGDDFANPNSPHREGRRAAAAIAVARDQVTAALHDQPGSPKRSGRLVFTSGATEAANLAIKGVAALAPLDRRHVVTIATEHACVLDSCDWLEREGWRVTRLGVGVDGLVDLDEAEALIGADTALVAAMLVNNEIGVVQPIDALARMARRAGALMFCDAVQGFGRVPVPVADCDLVALSAYKIYGPKGIGALWIRAGVDVAPLIHGGGQEFGLRSGTLSPALCAGFGAAATLASARMAQDAADVEALWTQAQGLLDCGWRLNGAANPRWHGNLNLRRDGLDANRLISELRDIAFSAGSACGSGSGRPSHVLRALGLSDVQASSSIRVGFGRGTDPQAFADALAVIDAAADRQLRT
ncbi:MAG TPA: cysteine desulfurase family protein [Sphingomonadaceae bacterium]|nr:cysteine desulfurase family protein [Sphingomonadaceae bacterium]